MAALVVQSRFAVLDVEDDDYPSSNQKNKKTKPTDAKKGDSAKKSKNNGNKAQTASAQKKRKSKTCPVSDDQWEMWKQKDEELVDGNYESELQQALILSKIDYEEKKDVYKQLKKVQAEKKAPDTSRGGSKKKEAKKKNVMSLDQFNEMVSGDDAKCENHVESPEEPQSPEKETDFFERVKDTTKNIIFMDKMNDRVKNRLSMPDEVITRVKFADALEKKDKEIAELKDEIDSLKKELMTVKCRNKKLCNILGQGEMKDKAEILVEVERLRSEQAELTAELAALHTDLEKERSKNADPRTNKEKKHTAKKKNIRFDVSSEALITKDTSIGTA